MRKISERPYLWIHQTSLDSWFETLRALPPGQTSTGKYEQTVNPVEVYYHILVNIKIDPF